MAELTREEFIAQFGFDPADVAVDPSTLNRGGVKDHLRSAATGVLSIPTDLVGLGGTVGSAIQGGVNSYLNDTKFTDEFNKSMHIDGVDANKQAHIDQVVASWRADNPNLTEEEINAGIANYSKSKEFEDFMQTQLRGSNYVAAASKDAIRSWLGDERPDSERSWTETAAEIAGSAAVPGPTGWAGKVGSAASKTAVTNAIFNNPVGKVGLKTAEILTPLTMPYTPANVATNALAGIGLDQAQRVIFDKPNAFTTPPNTPPDSGVGTIAAWGGGIVAAAAIVAAVRNRTTASLHAGQQLTPTARLLETPDPRMKDMQDAVVDPAMQGQSALNAGRPQVTEQPSYMDNELSIAQATARRTGDATLDQGYAFDKTIKDLQGGQRAEELEALRSQNSGSRLNDTIRQVVVAAMEPLQGFMRNLLPENASALMKGAQMSSYLAHWRDVVAGARAEINRLGQVISQPSIPSATKAKAIADQQALTSRLSAFIADKDPNLRLMLPNISMAQVRRLANAFERDASPQAMQFKKLLREWGDAELDALVKGGIMSTAERNRLRASNQYYVPAMNDPLKGATGLNRMYQSGVNRFKMWQQNRSRGAGDAVAEEGAIRSLDKEIPKAGQHGLTKPETRITSLHDGLSTMKIYTFKNRLEVAHAIPSKAYIRNFAFIDGIASKGWTTAHQKGYIERIKDSGGNEWRASETRRSTEVKDLLRRDDVVIEWDNGRFRLWRFGDTEFARMLRQEPVILQGLMRQAAKSASLFKQLTTGYLNPAFALKGSMYNTIIGMMTRSPDRVFGPASAMLGRVLPDKVMKHTVGRMIDPTVPLGMPWHLGASLIEAWVGRTARITADGLSNPDSPFAVMKSVLGAKNFDAIVRASLRVAHYADNMATNTLARHGASPINGSLDNIVEVRDAFSTSNELVPNFLRGAWAFYKDTINAVYMAPQRMFYTQNLARLQKKFPNGVPEKELLKLIDETANLGGNMSKVPGSDTMRQAEAITPYLSQTKLGAYHLIRHMGDPQMMSYMMPRLALMTYAIGQSMYWRTNWNKESAEDYWKRTPESERYRYIHIPTPKLLYEWAAGRNPEFDPKLVYRIPLPPDITGIVAGTTAMMQMTGMLPSNATPTTAAESFVPTVLKSLIPAVPPPLQALAALGGMKLEPQTSDTRGGDVFRSFKSSFTSGPQAEAAGNLGEVSTTWSLMASAWFGAMGANLASSVDVFLHASKFGGETTPQGRLVPLNTPDFMRGLDKATNNFVAKASENVPDVPLLWKGNSKYSVTTPAWQYMADATAHIRSISDIKTQAIGEASQRRRDMASQAGGIAAQSVTNPLLLEIAEIVSAWSNPSGEMGKLTKVYNDLATANSSAKANYNLPPAEVRARSNHITKQMQDNKEQQYLATIYLEQQLAEKYGEVLAPITKGRSVTLQSIDQMLREMTGAGPTPQE